MNTSYLTFFVFLFLLIPVSVMADDTLKQGEKIFEKQCSECHQKDGNSTDEDIPKISGFSAILTYDILDQFKTSDRKALPIKTKSGEKTNMSLISKKLMSDEIEAISLYLAKQTFKPAKQTFNKELAMTGKELHMDLCENCHVDEGTNPIEDAPIQRGQWKLYLIKQFELLSQGHRSMPRRMKKRFRKLSDEDKKALIEFYISPKENASE